MQCTMEKYAAFNTRRFPCAANTSAAAASCAPCANLFLILPGTILVSGILLLVISSICLGSPIHP